RLRALGRRPQDRRAVAGMGRAIRPPVHAKPGTVRVACQRPGAWNKALLRRSLSGRIPDPVRNRLDKRGFPTSLHVSVTDVLAEPQRDLLRTTMASIPRPR